MPASTLTLTSRTQPRTIAEDKVLMSNDRVFKLSPIGKAKQSGGLIDARLFTGENKLHLIQGPGNNLWHFRYEVGAVPPALMNRFTSYQAAFNHAKAYFLGRNVNMEEDVYASAA